MVISATKFAFFINIFEFYQLFFILIYLIPQQNLYEYDQLCKRNPSKQAVSDESSKFEIMFWQ